MAARAEQVWGSDEKLEEEQLRRAENKEQAKRKKFDKRIKGIIWGFFSNQIICH